jgi:hypothetical protein
MIVYKGADATLSLGVTPTTGFTYQYRVAALGDATPLLTVDCLVGDDVTAALDDIELDPGTYSTQVISTNGETTIVEKEDQLVVMAMIE